MTTKRKPTVDDLYDQRYHNQPETGSLSLAEQETIEAGRVALSALVKSFDLWVAIARAIKTLRDKADRIGGRQTFKRLMYQNGFPLEGHNRVFEKATATRLLRILDNLPEVTKWHEGLTDKQKREWASPTTVFKHCPVFAKPKPAEEERRPSPMEQLKQANVALQEENHKLKQREDGDRFKPTDTAEDIATVLIGMFSPTKAADIAQRVLTKLKKVTKLTDNKFNQQARTGTAT